MVRFPVAYDTSYDFPCTISINRIYAVIETGAYDIMESYQRFDTIEIGPREMLSALHRAILQSNGPN